MYTLQQKAYKILQNRSVCIYLHNELYVFLPTGMLEDWFRSQSNNGHTTKIDFQQNLLLEMTKKIDFQQKQTTLGQASVVIRNEVIHKQQREIISNEIIVHQKMQRRRSVVRIASWVTIWHRTSSTFQSAQAYCKLSAITLFWHRWQWSVVGFSHGAD